MILPVYIYNHPVLRNKAAAVTDMSADLALFIENMFETMYNAGGVGLAANQVGSTHAIAVIDAQDDDDEALKNEQPLVLINPVIEAWSDETEEFEEGCLSLPDFRDIVIRPEAIQVRYLDRSLKEVVREVDGFLARVIQHEVDHLNGMYFFERLSGIRKTLSQGKLKRIAKGDVKAEYPLFIP